MKTIREIIESIPNGRFFRITYRSELPIKAEYQKKGVSSVKYVTTTSRTGVKYTNIEGVVPSENPSKSNYFWLVRNKIAQHLYNKTEYVQLAPIGKGSNRKTVYMIHDNDGCRNIRENEVGKYVIPSYFSQKEAPKIIRVKLKNVIEVNA